VSAVAVTLREWETIQPNRNSPLAGRNLNSDATRSLAEDLGKAGCIEVLELARGLEVRTTSFVGRLSLGEVTITVRPKLPGAPFLSLLRYAYGLRHLALYNPVEYASEKWAFQDLLVQQLATEVSKLLARGVHREYDRIHEQLANPRGRIDFDRLIEAQHRDRASLPCIHYPRTEDTVLNQIILAGLAHATRLVTSLELRSRVSRLVKSMSESISLKTLTFALLDRGRQAIDRRTMAYQPILSLIELLVEGEGVSFNEKNNRIQLPGFLFDMNRFFQTLISRFLHDHLEDYEIQDESRLKNLFCYDSDRNPWKRRAPVQKPDFVIRRNGRIEAILDAKYRDLWAKSLPREMLYQLALYALGQDGNERSAVILYPTLAMDAADQAIQLRAPVGGDLQAQVVLRPVNLLTLEKLLRDKEWRANKRRVELAHQLSFGSTRSEYRPAPIPSCTG
jgi:5-methylcytosine-specific restriction enzyme subunit McrC